MNVLVTGAAGFIGSHIAAHLRLNGHQVRAVDVHPARKGRAAVEIADLLLRESAYRITEGVDAVVHMANWPNGWRAAPTQILLDNVTMNQHLIQAMLEREIKTLVFASSIQAISGHVRVHDEGPSGVAYLPLDGDIPAHPANSYGLSKQHGEAQCGWFATRSRGSAVAIRFPSVVEEGFSEDPRGHERFGYGSRDEAFLAMHVDDAALLVACILERQQPGYRCVQAGSFDHALPLSAPEIVAEYYHDVPCRRDPATMTSLCDLDLLQREFGFVPRVRLWGQASAAK